MDENKSPEEQDEEIIEAQIGPLPGHPAHARAGQQQQYDHPHKEHHEKAQSKWQKRWQRLKEFVKECRRVLKVTKKPNREEYKTIVKISGSGILIIGFMGFLIFFAREGIRQIFG